MPISELVNTDAYVLQTFVLLPHIRDICVHPLAYRALQYANRPVLGGLKQDRWVFQQKCMMAEQVRLLLTAHASEDSKLHACHLFCYHTSETLAAIHWRTMLFNVRVVQCSMMRSKFDGPPSIGACWLSR